MLDTAKLLKLSRINHQNKQNVRNISFKNNEIRKICYENVDVSISKLADYVGWYKYWQIDSSEKEDILLNYVNGLDAILWLAQVEQWMHLIVLEKAEIIKLCNFPRRNQNDHYLGLKTMLWNCYLTKNQADYTHLWRSYLKFGLVELKLTPEAIMTSFEKNFN